MRSSRDDRSPWGKRVYFESHEFETMMQGLLLRAGSDVFVAGSGVDVDRVLLAGLELEADYVSLPNGVLGRTLFLADGSAQVQVSRELADEAEVDTIARRRLRTTLAHECGHVACHRTLFLADTETISLFPSSEGQEEEKPAILCRESTVAPGYSGEWWEYQANRCMASLLLPRHLLAPQFRAVLTSVGVDSYEEAAKQGKDEGMVRTLANMFDISWQALLYRLRDLGFIPTRDQLDQRNMEVEGDLLLTRMGTHR